MADMPDPSSLLEQLVNSRNRDVSMFLPFILGMSMSGSDPDDQDSSNRDRIILINTSRQEMMVIDGRSSESLESMMRDLMMSNKEGQPPASKASIEALPRVEIKEEDGEGECVICLEEWRGGDVAREMPCKHRFHGECVDKWLKVHGTCPVCRYRMPVDDLGKKTGSQTNERENEERGRGRGIWVSFSIGNEEDSTSQTNDSS